MAQIGNCSTKQCPLAAAAALDGQTLCQEHFILASYRLLDEAAAQLRQAPRSGPSTTLLAHRLDGCVRATTDLALSFAEPNNLARARLIDILLWAAELFGQMRRGPRVGMAVAVVLAGSSGGDSWEETTTTQTVSRRGASLRCARALAQGEVVKITRLDTGQQASARVAWSARKAEGVFEIGLELLNEQNLWGVDRDLPQAPRGGAGQGTRAN